MKIRATDSIERLSLYRPAGAPITEALPLVLVCPGGGYCNLAPHEAEPVAKWATDLGVASAVLTYRINPEARHPNPLNDTLDAMRTLRRNASALGLSGKIVVLGFSAGGHLAASLSVHGAADPETRPDGSILVYPVVTMLDHTHAGSRAALLGENPTAEMKQKMSCELQVTPRTPPAFIVHGFDDSAVPVENALDYAAALTAHRVPFELHVYPYGPHGFGMGNDRVPPGTPIAEWPRLAGVWLKNLFAV